MAFTDYTFAKGETTITAEMMTALVNELKDIEKNSGKRLFPVGSVYFSKTATNPASFLGGTWQLIAQGRTVIGHGTGTDAEGLSREFTAGEEGGSYNLAKHTHNTAEHTHTIGCASGGAHTHNVGVSSSNAASGSARKAAGASGTASSSNGNHKHTMTCSTQGATMTTEAGTGTSGNLPPYLVLYIFERTA